MAINTKEPIEGENILQKKAVKKSNVKKKSDVKEDPPESVKFEKKRNDIKKCNIVYPIFSECVKYTNDEFWKNLFDDLSLGKYPKSIYISGGTIYPSNKRKGFSYIIPTNEDKSPQEVATELRTLLIENTSICSTTDISEKRKELKEKNLNVDEITNETTWSKIKKKNIREILIIKYVIRMKEEHKLNWEQTRGLNSLIQMGFIYKMQTSKNVHFNNKQIQKIDGIVFDKKSNQFINEYIDNEIPIEKDENEENENNYLSLYWDRYVLNSTKAV